MDNTTKKLHDALSTLITAYEELQDKYTTLEKENEDLKNEITILNSEKTSLESNLDHASSTKDQQSTDMNSMLSKIESILKFKTGKEENRSNQTEEPEQSVITKVDDIHVNEQKDEQKNDTGKIDLNRMESLLNGFGSK
ncbi:MAG: hypothetical protein U9N30_08035 [Campylobacterota bacterium]|nr:hypothetical protein [Campylobacterota bacterium]